MTISTSRYQAFLRAHAHASIGKPPNHRFMQWINEQWMYYASLHPEASSDPDAFDAWLTSEFPPPAA